MHAAQSLTLLISDPNPTSAKGQMRRLQIQVSKEDIF
jgi:hypothetical protein